MKDWNVNSLHKAWKAKNILEFNAGHFLSVGDFLELKASVEAVEADTFPRSRLPFFIYGTGNLGAELLGIAHQSGISVNGFIDRDPKKIGTDFCGLRVHAPSPRLRERVLVAVWNLAAAMRSVRDWCKSGVHSYAEVLLTSSLGTPYWCLQSPTADLSGEDVQSLLDLEVRLAPQYRSELAHQVASQFMFGLHREARPTYAPDEEYFTGTLAWPRPDECFLDIGAFDGDTVTRFLDRAPEAVYAIAVEPDRLSFALLAESLAQDSRVKCINALVGKSHGTGLVRATGNPNSRESEVGGELVPRVSVDDIVSESPAISRIKVDAEGAEVEILEGARETIASAKAAWTLATYHRPGDLWKFPQYFSADDYTVEIASHAERPWDGNISFIPRSFSPTTS